MPIKSEILPKWITEIFYSQFAMFVYDFHDYDLWNTAGWEEPALDNFSYPLLIVVWNALAPSKYQLVGGQICTALKTHFVIKYLVRDHVLINGLCHSIHQWFLSCVRHYSISSIWLHGQNVGQNWSNFGILMTCITACHWSQYCWHMKMVIICGKKKITIHYNVSYQW